jgi:hypothetical protein
MHGHLNVTMRGHMNVKFSFQYMLKEFPINFVRFIGFYKLRIKVTGLSRRTDW